ncbi:MAG: hypothetical protein WC538_10580 [Thermoanaerobaculia bacterium]|jgi:hypothetical protein
MNFIAVSFASHVRRVLSIAFVVSLGSSLHADDTEQRLLLPLDVVVQGGYGSLFSTHLTAFNKGATPVEVRGIVPFCPLSPCLSDPIPAVVLVPGHATGEFENHGTPGRFVFYPSSAQLDFNLRARDSSRDQLSYGTEVPVVAGELFRSRPFNLLAVQSAQTFRAMLRVYGIAASTVTVRALRQADDRVLDQWSLQLSEPGNEYEPAYAEIALPGWGVSFVRIEISPQSEQFPVWAFASVTNNVTQQFTLVTPR